MADGKFEHAKLASSEYDENTAGAFFDHAVGTNLLPKAQVFEAPPPSTFGTAGGLGTTTEALDVLQHIQTAVIA